MWAWWGRAKGSPGLCSLLRTLEQPWGFVLREVFPWLIQNVLPVTVLRVFPMRTVDECLGRFFPKFLHNSWEAIKRVKGFRILDNLKKKTKQEQEFPSDSVKVPSQTFFSAKDKYSVNSIYKDHMSRQDISWQKCFFFIMLLIQNDPLNFADTKANSKFLLNWKII